MKIKYKQEVVVKLLDPTKTYREIVKETGIPMYVLAYYARKANMSRKRGRCKMTKPGTKHQAFIDLYAAGWTYMAIGALFNVTFQAVENAIYRYK